ncbi:MAG: nucleotide exchange factor GrpE [Cyanobium sp. M30B3]|nr:MAG: nucleotide exchange factor GrpE [Cyanobium sp. M30B3]
MSGDPAVGPEAGIGADQQAPQPAPEPVDHQSANHQSAGDQAEVAQVEGQPPAAEQEPEAPASEASPQSVAQLEAQLTALRAEHDNLNGQYVRLAADFDNFRKRQSRDNDDLRLQITCGTLSEILPVLDNFERARQQLNPQHEEAQTLHRSYQGLYKQLVDVFKQLGVAPMRVEGEPFDPNLHEAVLREESDEHPEDVIVAELQRGYHLNGRVLRHALVKVSMGPGPGAAAGDAPEPSTPASPEA